MSKLEHSSRKHALLSASGASRWLNCTPSARLEEEFTEIESDFAAEGTLAHELAELALLHFKKSIRLPRYLAQVELREKNKLFSEEMHAEVAKYTGYVIDQFNSAKNKDELTELLVEEKVEFTHLVEEGFGTCDANIISDGTLEVIDLKYGKGVKVSPSDNPQLKLYAIGALRLYDMAYDIENVRLTIVQPRLDHIESWEISVKDLEAWGETEVKPKAKLAFEGKGDFVAGDQCRWCKAKNRCRTLAEKNLEVAKHNFADPCLLNDSELIEVFKQMPAIQNWIKSVGEYLLAEAKNGKKWPEHKLVEGKSSRKWKDEDKIKEVLSESYKTDQYLNTKLKGIGDIEKLVTKKAFPELLGSYVIKPAGAPTLVHESDKRPGIGIAQAKEAFKE